jgi:hypothetical protein
MFECIPAIEEKPRAAMFRGIPVREPIATSLICEELHRLDRHWRIIAYSRHGQWKFHGEFGQMKIRTLMDEGVGAGDLSQCQGRAADGEFFLYARRTPPLTQLGAWKKRR